MLALVVASASATASDEEAAGDEGSSGAPAVEPVPEAPPATPPGSGHRAQEDIPDAFRSARIIPGGSFLLGYEYDHLTRSSNRSGTDRVSVSRIFERGFTRTSFRQEVERHTLEVLYAPTDRITLGASLPVFHIDTRYRTPDGSSFTTGNQGVGDLELSGRLLFTRKGQECFILHLALQAPSGEIDSRDRTPDGRERLPYDEQLGGGTWNFLPAITYVGQYRETSWGVQVGADVSIGENDHGWSRPDVFHTGGWLAQRFFDLLTSQMWLEWRDWGDVDGRDDHISQTWPSGNPNFYGGARLVLGTGLELAIPHLKGQRLSVDASFPVYQSLDGPQLESRWRLRAGWEWVF